MEISEAINPDFLGVPTGRATRRHCPCHPFFRANGPRGGFHPPDHMVYQDFGWDWNNGMWLITDKNDKRGYRTVSGKSVASRRERRREEEAARPTPIPTQTGEVMEIDGGNGGGLEHSRHAPRPEDPAAPPSSPPRPALPLPRPAGTPSGAHPVATVVTQVQWSGMVVPDSMAEIPDSQPSFPPAFSSALASAVASVAGSLAGSPAQSVVDDDGDETMGENAAHHENQTDL